MGSEPQSELTATLLSLALLAYCQTKKYPSTILLEISRSKQAETQMPSFSFLRQMCRVGCAAIHFIAIYPGASFQGRRIAGIVAALMTGITPLKFVSLWSRDEAETWLEVRSTEALPLQIFSIFPRIHRSL